MRRLVLGISVGVILFSASGEIRAQNNTCSSAQDCTQKWLMALNANPPVEKTVEGFYTPDAVGVFSEGIFTTNTAIATDLIAQVTNPQAPWKNIKIPLQKDQNTNNVAWSYGCFTATVGGQPVVGYWSVLWTTGSSWKMQQMTTTPAQATACPSA
jgi:hypothetical protein